MNIGPTITVGKIQDVPVKIHWSFSLILVMVGYMALAKGFTIWQTCSFGLLIVAIFTGVILHELGHALVAKRYGIETNDIILMPIGGIARLKSLPTDPLKEIGIAMAGPLVNLAIALSIYLVFRLRGIGWIQPDVDLLSCLNTLIGFMHLVLLINAASFLINLVPVLPMDGGRILRALLSLKMERSLANKVTRVVSSLILLAFALLFLVF